MSSVISLTPGIFLFPVCSAKFRKVHAEELNHDDYLTASPRRQYLQQQCLDHDGGDQWQDFPIQRGLDRSSPSPAHRRQRLASAAGNPVSWSGRSGGRLLPPTPKQPSTLNIDTLQNSTGMSFWPALLLTVGPSSEDFLFASCLWYRSSVPNLTQHRGLHNNPVT